MPGISVADELVKQENTFTDKNEYADREDMSFPFIGVISK